MAMFTILTLAAHKVTLGTHSDDILLMLLNLRRQLIGSTPVGSVGAGKLNLCKETYCYSNQP